MPDLGRSLVLARTSASGGLKTHALQTRHFFDPTKTADMAHYKEITYTEGPITTIKINRPKVRAQNRRWTAHGPA